MFKKYFDSEEVNTGRQVEFDVARAFSIVGMIITHCYESSGLDFTKGFGGLIAVIFGSFFGATLFMFYMGAAIRYSRHSDSKSLILRGIVTFVIGYALNIFRKVLPWIVVDNITGAGFDRYSYIILLFGLDILQFAGLSFIAIGIAKKINTSDRILILIAVILSIIGSFTKGMEIDNPLVAEFLGLFIGTKCNGEIVGFFSFCHYFLFVAFGYYYGKIWKRCKDKKGLYLRFSPIFGVIGILGFAIEIIYGFGIVGVGDLSLYYFIGIPDALLCFSNAMAFSGIYYHMCIFCNNRFVRVTRNLSSNIEFIYIFHLILVRWIVFVLLINVLHIEMTNLIVILVAAFLAILSYKCALLVKKSNGETG